MTAQPINSQVISEWARVTGIDIPLKVVGHVLQVGWKANSCVTMTDVIALLDQFFEILFRLQEIAQMVKHA